MPGTPTLVHETSFCNTSHSGTYDSLVIVTHSLDAVPEEFRATIDRARKVDKPSFDDGGVGIVWDSTAPGERLVVSVVSDSNSEGCDRLRAFADAATSAVQRASSASSQQPLLLLIPSSSLATSSVVEVSLLAILQALYEPLQARENDSVEEPKLEPVRTLGFVVSDASVGARVAAVVSAIEAGRRLARDIGGGDPERMTPQNCASYLIESFQNSSVTVEVVSDVEQIRTEYPLAHAVARASLAVERHHPRIVRLEYHNTESAVEETLLFSGKGIVYDTGGADIKVGGSMAGMHLDKGGACNIAGFVKTVSLLKPKGLRVLAELGFVRNSCGSDSYVADEIIRGHSGARVQVINTDAEGRMVLSDMLSHLRQKVVDDPAAYPNAHLFTCATLTGHASRSVGPYTIAMDNSTALAHRTSYSLQESSTEWGDPIEVSLLRREDFKWAKPKNKKADVLQMGTGPAATRGHQFGASFLILSSGLDKHSATSAIPLNYTHLDIAGSAAEGGDYKFGKPTATPVVGLTARFVLGRASI